MIIDKEKDVRICDGYSVVKVRFEGQKIKDILADDIFVYPTKLREKDADVGLVAP